MDQILDMGDGWVYPDTMWPKFAALQNFEKFL